MDGFLATFLRNKKNKDKKPLWDKSFRGFK